MTYDHLTAYCLLPRCASSYRARAATWVSPDLTLTLALTLTPNPNPNPYP